MKVYVITSGIYSDYGIEAVSLDKDDAERKCATLNNQRNDDFCEIEEYDTEDVKVESDKELKSRFKMIVGYKNGNIYMFDGGGYLVLNDINKIEVKRYMGEDRIYSTATLPRGTKPEKAKKIMLDRIAKFKAERTGIV